jgi:hypothetical protein
VKVGIYCRLGEEDRNKQTKTDDSEKKDQECQRPEQEKIDIILNLP